VLLIVKRCYRNSVDLLARGKGLTGIKQRRRMSHLTLHLLQILLLQPALLRSLLVVLQVLPRVVDVLLHDCIDSFDARIQ
jgi:hypothetical protein